MTTGREDLNGQHLEESGLLDLALIFAENLRLLILLPVGAGLAAMALTFVLPPTYTASTRILPPAQQQSTSAALAAQLGSLAGLVGAGSGIKNPADQYVALLKSRSVYDALIKRFDLNQLYETRYTEDARKELEKRSRIYAGIKDGIISIEVDDPDASRAAQIANAFVEELRNLSKTLAITEAAQRRLFFETQLEQARDNLTRSESALRGSGLSEALLKTMPQSALEALARLRAQITAQEIKLASMRAFMTETNPEFRVAIQELTALRAELSKAEQSNISKTTDNGAQYITKYRDFKYHETLFELIARQFELARLDEAREGALVQVIDLAQAPQRKSKPRVAFTATLTALAGLFAATLYILLRHLVLRTAANPAAAAKFRRLRSLLALRRV